MRHWMHIESGDMPMCMRVNFGYYRCPNAQRRFRNVMDKFMSAKSTTLLVATIEPAALREFPAYVEHQVQGAYVSNLQKYILTESEKEEALEFDDEALLGGVSERLVFTVSKTTTTTGAE
ncbi:hypothetical protein ACV4QK_20880 (plasmid) [Alteromonas macleodii]